MINFPIFCWIGPIYPLGKGVVTQRGAAIFMLPLSSTAELTCEGLFQHSFYIMKRLPIPSLSFSGLRVFSPVIYLPAPAQPF